MNLSSYVGLPQSHIVIRRELIVALTLLCALTANFLFASGHDLQRCIELVALSVAATVFLARAARGSFPKVPSSTSALMLVFLVLGLVSTSMAISSRHAIYEWSSLLLLLVLIFTLAAELSHGVHRIDALLHWVGIACGLYSLRIVLLYAAALASGYQPDWAVLSPGFSNPRFMNHTQTALFPLIVLLCLKAPPHGGWRKLWFALASFWWALLFVTEARASILALAVGSVTAVTLRRAHARPFLGTMAGTALAGIALYIMVFTLLPVLFGLQPVGSPLNVVERSVANPASDRFLLWKLAEGLIAAHPWLGVGPHHFAHEGAKLYAGAHPHSWVLQIATEWGIPALLCLVSASVLAVRALIRSGARVAETDLANQNMLVTLQVACAAILVDGMLSGVIVMPQSQLAIALVLGIAYAWVRQRVDIAPQANVIQPASSRFVMAVIVAIGFSGLIWSIAPDFVRHARGDVLTPAELASNPEQHWPRMWEAGYF